MSQCVRFFFVLVYISAPRAMLTTFFFTTFIQAMLLQNTYKRLLKTPYYSTRIRYTFGKDMHGQCV